jgi:hypothetical protein
MIVFGNAAASILFLRGQRRTGKAQGVAKRPRLKESRASMKSPGCTYVDDFTHAERVLGRQSVSGWLTGSQSRWAAFGDLLRVVCVRARKIRRTHFVIDGEAVVLGVDGVSDFNALHSRRVDHEVQLYAFDCLAYDGDDLSRLPLHLRKENLAQLLRGRSDGIFVAPFEQGEIGLEGLVSKHRERAYRGGRCDHWVKVKNRTHPAFSRVQDKF